MTASTAHWQCSFGFEDICEDMHEKRGTSKPMAAASESARCFAQLAIRYAVHVEIVSKDVVPLEARVCQC